MCNKVHRRHTGIPLEMITSFKPITDLTHRALKQFVILWCTPMCHSSLCSLVPRLLVGTHRESLGTRLQFVILWCSPSFQVTLCGRPGASPLPPLPPHWYQSSLHRNRRCTFSIPLEMKWYWSIFMYNVSTQLDIFKQKKNCGNLQLHVAYQLLQLTKIKSILLTICR